VCALPFFYRQVLQQEWAVEQIPYQRTGSKLPEILSPQEVSALLQATGNLKHRALLMTMCREASGGAGGGPEVGGVPPEGDCPLI